MTKTTRPHRVKAVAALCAFGLLAVACGDDDDPEATTATTAAEEDAAQGEYTEYCAAVAAMEENEGFDAAQFERIKDAAPDEIKAEIDYVADAFIEAEGDIGKVFADPEVEAKLGPIEEFEGEHCPGEDPDVGEEAIAPEFAEYCAATAELDEQDGPPTADQMEEIKTLAPEEIASEVQIVADAFIAGDGDMGQVFGDPAVEENLGAIEAWEAENCGGGDEDDEEDEPETEPIEGAQVVPVTGVDYAFEGLPATVPAGDVSFEFSNEGEAAHEMALFKLGEGVELDELLASEEEPSEDEAMEVGGTFAVPGQSGHFLNAEDLDAGTYAVVCFVPGPEGKAHHELGMKATFTVS